MDFFLEVQGEFSYKSNAHRTFYKFRVSSCFYFNVAGGVNLISDFGGDGPCRAAFSYRDYG